MYVSSLKYHIASIVFMPSDEWLSPGNNAVPIFINVLTETSKSDRKFYFSEKFLAIKLETESLSDLNVQSQYYYCKPDDEMLSTASQKIWGRVLCSMGHAGCTLFFF